MTWVRCIIIGCDWYGMQNVTKNLYSVTQWPLKTVLRKLQSGKVILCNTNTLYVHFVQSTVKQSVHFRSNILWTYDQAPYGRTSWHPNAVRPDTLWTYDQASYGRTSMENIHGKYGVLCPTNAISGRLRIAYLPQRHPLLIFFAFSEVVRKSKCKENLRNSNNMPPW